MKRLLSFGLLTLLFYHTLATMWVAVGVWWQDQHDLTERLVVYSSVDSIVEFQVVLKAGQTQSLVEQTTQDGFTYHGRFYDVINVELHGDTLRIAGMVNKTTSFWQQDLLSFIKRTIGVPTGAESQRKAGQWLKLLLKEYRPADHFALLFSSPRWLIDTRIADASCVVPVRYLAVLSPPPRC